MIAAIYARKSTEQSGVADEARSVTRQIEHATAFAIRKGWTVDDACVYIDDGISGAEFAKRAGFLRLMNALKPRPPFQALVISEESRLGREQIETSYALKQLVTSGVQVWCYLDNRQRTLDSPMEKAMLALQGMADEMEREKARQRTYDAMLRKARAGHVTGGRVFGYENVEICDAEGRRQHVTRRILEAEAAVIGRIFESCAAGQGLRTIAKALNADGVPAPRAQQGRPCAWVSTTIREVLYRPLYRGVIVWNKTRKRNAWGLERRTVKAAADWITIDAPELRVVTEGQWQAAHGRLEHTRQTYLRGTHGHLWGRPVDGHESKYLLTGLSRCGICGGTMIVRSRQHGSRRAYFYACSSFHHRGKTVCANSMEMRLADADDAVLSALERKLLDPAILEAAIARAAARVALPPEDPAARRHAIAVALGQAEAALAHLTQAVAEGGAVATLVQAIRDQERRHQTLRAELADLDRPRVVPVSLSHLKGVLQTKAEEWQGLLRKHAPIARQMVRKLVEGRIVFTPDRDARRYTFRVPGTLANFFSGIVGPQAMASPAGSGDEYWEVPLAGAIRKAA
ncbi:MAG: recombinase family protein [Acidobacteriota bacterium]